MTPLEGFVHYRGMTFVYAMKDLMGNFVRVIIFPVLCATVISL